MNKQFKHAFAFFMAIVMVFGMFPATAITASAETASTGATASLSTVNGMPGELVTMDITVENAPGLTGFVLFVEYDQALTLKTVEFNPSLTERGGMVSTPEPYENPQQLSFISWQKALDINGVFATLTFQVSETAEDRYVAPVRLSYTPDDVNNDDGNVPLTTVDGAVNVFHGLAGDINADGKVNTKDEIMLFRHVSGWKGLPVDLDAVDCNGDGKANTKDAVLLFRYIADWDVKITRGLLHTHVMEEIPYKAATCTQDGNNAYWHCTACGKNYNDVNGTMELTQEQTVIKALGHDIVVTPGKDPTYTEPGYTESRKCARCGEVLKEREEIPVLKPDEYTIKYHISDNDMYLKNIDADSKNPNPAVYTSQAGLTLKSMSIPGYNFLGWYDGIGSDAVRIREIPVGSKGDWELFAIWEKVPYTIEFDSPDMPVQSITYTVDEGKGLPKPKIRGYTFVGWSMDGALITEIKPGYLPKESNKVTVHANWTSNRNQTRPVERLGSPSIIEDVTNGYYMFLYKIGTIENVPLNVIKTFTGNSGGLHIDQEYVMSNKVQTSMAESAATTVADATTRSSSWTLSEDWNEGSSTNVEQGETIGKTNSQIKTDGVSSTDKWYVGSNQSGTTSVSSGASGSSSVSAKVTNQNSVGLNSTYQQQHKESETQDRQHSVDVGVHAKTNKWGFDIDAGVDYGYTNQKHNETSEEQSLKASVARNEYNETIGTSSSTASWESNNSVTNSWNSDKGYEAGSTASRETEIQNSISENILKKYQISSTKSRGGDKGFSITNSENTTQEKEYVSSVEHSKEQEITTTIHQKIDINEDGYFRLVTAGTIHVFAVVGYDIANRSYFTYTYNVLDGNDRHPYLDYSKNDAHFQDCQNGVLPFEVPYEVQKYVGDKLAATDGLAINYNTGMVEKYTGTGKNVVIPEYVSVSNQNDTYSAVKVTGIAPEVFQNNENLEGVYFPKYVSSIPAHAFEGCTSMKTLVGNGLINIGDYAFKGCTGLNDFYVDHLIESMGVGAFEGAGGTRVTAANAAVADAALASGAKNLTLNMQKMSDPFNDRKIVISDQMETFKFWDNGAARENLQIESHAGTTVLNNLNLAKNSNIPLKIYSPNLTLNRTTAVSAPGFAMVLFADQTNIKLFSDNDFSSESSNTVLAKKLALSQEDAGVIGKLNVTGTTLLCDTNITNADMFNGTIKQIDPGDFDNYLNTHKLIFNANGGNVDVSSKAVIYGSPCGELPVPTKSGFGFAGWYTAADGGTKYSESTVFDSVSDVTLYAHWTANAYTVSWKSGTGCNIRVNRTSSPSYGAAIGTLSNGETVYENDVIEIEYTAIEGYTITSHGLTSATVKGNLTSDDIYASARVNSYKVSWNENPGCAISVSRTSSPKQGASNGKLSNGAAVYYGDTLKITYTPNAGYVLNDNGRTSVTVTGNVTSRDIYAVTGNQVYHVNWNSGSHCSIRVERTSSPRGMGTGSLSNGAAIYYGDVLRVTYLADTGYKLTRYGSEQITVTGDVGSSSIYASAAVQSYTYRIYYRSVNGTNLGSTTATYEYGTTHTFSAPEKAGYHTPGAQTVKWDSTSGKDIVFYYKPMEVSNPSVSGQISEYYSMEKIPPTVSYSAAFEFRNRTADSIEVRVTVTETIKYSYWCQWSRWVAISSGGKTLTDLRVVDYDVWTSTSQHNRSETATSVWFRVPVNTTNATTVTLDALFYDRDNYNEPITGRYTQFEKNWTINIPAY